MDGPMGLDIKFLNYHWQNSVPNDHELVREIDKNRPSFLHGSALRPPSLQGWAPPPPLTGAEKIYEVVLDNYEWRIA